MQTDSIAIPFICRSLSRLSIYNVLHGSMTVRDDLRNEITRHFSLDIVANLSDFLSIKLRARLRSAILSQRLNRARARSVNGKVKAFKDVTV